MSDYLKHIKNMIEKYAQDAPTRRVPKKTPSTSIAPPSPKGAPTRNRGHSKITKDPISNISNLAFSSNVETMQKSLSSLARDVLGQLRVGDISKSQTDDQNKRQVGEAMGRTSFSDFITKHYMRKSPIQATEFNPDPTKTKMEDKSPTGPTRMYTIMDTMNRLGGSTAETEADGKWGPRTNVALHDVNAFAYSMLQLAKDFELTIKSYSESDRSEFASKIPENDTDLNYQQKNDFAPAFTKHINTIHQMFNEIKSGILQNPEHQTYIEADTPYATFNKVEQLDPQEQDIIKFWIEQRLPSNNTQISMPLPGGNGNLVAMINYADLGSPDSFKEWISSDAAKQFKQTGVDKPMIIDAIRKALQARAGVA